MNWGYLTRKCRANGNDFNVSFFCRISAVCPFKSSERCGECLRYIRRVELEEGEVEC